jgi:hypothetical protein
MSHIDKIHSREYNELFWALINRAYNNPSVNMDDLLEKSLDGAIQNVVWMNFRTQFYLINTYRKFLQKNLHSQISQPYIKCTKIAKYIEEDFNINNLFSLKKDEILELLLSFSFFEIGNPEFYTECDKYLGKHIDTFHPDLYTYILDAFVRNGNHREKFVNLIIAKVLEKKEQMSLSNLCKLMRIFASMKLSNEAIFEKLHDYFISKRHMLEDYEISDLVYSYANLKMPNNMILSDLEEFIEVKNKNWIYKMKFDIIIDILNSYLVAKKGENNFLNVLKDGLIKNYEIIKEDKLDEMSVIKLFIIFGKMKLESQEAKLFDALLRKKLKYFSREDYLPVYKSLNEINYDNEETIEILKKLDELGNNKHEKVVYLKSLNLL